MKHKFQNAKIVVGENSKEIQEILFGLGYMWLLNPRQIVKHLEMPFLIIDSDGEISYENNNEFFYEHENPLITLDTLKQWQWQSENIELVEKEFYYYEADNISCIFQHNYNRMDNKNKLTIFEYYSYYTISDTLYSINSNGLILLSKIELLRPATPEEIQLLKDKVKEQTGKVFNEQTKIFEEPKKEVVFKPFDKVLVRDRETSNWVIDMYRHKLNNDKIYNYACFVDCWIQCIPYEGNEHLLGTTNNPE